MVLEVGLIDVLPGTDAAFAQSYAQVRHALIESPGCRSVRMTHGIETPSRFVLMVEWEEISDHEAFRNSPRFAVWRGGIGEYFANPPHVEHFADID